jgi:hypothetical protein
MQEHAFSGVFTKFTLVVPPITPPLPAGLPDPSLCDADGYPYYHLSQKKNFDGVFPFASCCVIQDRLFSAVLSGEKM